MRRLFLIRHGHPDFPVGERWCLGHTDLPLGPVGKMQAALLPYNPELTGKPVFCSRLSRAVETARPLCAEPEIRDGLEEQNMGEWDGLSFTVIRERFPELYAAREKNPELWPPSAEDTEQVRRRMDAALRNCLRESEGDIVIVSHKSAIASITGQRQKLLHCSVSTVLWDGSSLIPSEIGHVTRPPLSDDVCLSLLRAAGTPEPVIDHCRAVADEALRLLDTGFPGAACLDRELLRSAALLHDIARACPHHAELGAAWLRELGYPEAAEVMLRHHDCDAEELNEASLLFLADKYMQGTRRVTLEQRFSASAARCESPDAREAHARRRAAAEKLENQLKRS